MRATEAKPSFREFVLVWCRVALLSFGGPAGQIAVMHRLVVEEKRWVDDARFMHALNFCMLLPGPEAQQLATLVLGVLVWMLPVMLILPTLGQHHVLAQESLFFAKMSMVTFGGAYSVLAYITQQAVEVHQWLLPGEMIDGLGMAESTPGPLIQVVQFVGFMAAFRGAEPFSPIVAATIGAVVTTWMTFVPSFVLIFAGAPWMERLRHIAVLAGALRGITAAVVGVIASLTLWFAVHVLFAAQQDVVLGMMQFTLPVISSLQWSVLVLLVAALVALLRFGWGVGRVLLVTVPAGAGWYLLAAPL